MAPEVFDADVAHGATLATVLLGANDAALPAGPSAAQHVPLEEYKANLRAVVKAIRAAGVPHVLLLAPPPVDDARRALWQQQKAAAEGRPGADPGADRTNEFVRSYAAACCELAHELGLPCVDLWTEMQKHASWRTEYLNDGLHFTSAGNLKVFELLKDAMEAQFPALRIQTLPWHYPHWSCVDAVAPGDTFAAVAAQQQK